MSSVLRPKRIKIAGLLPSTVEQDMTIIIESQYIRLGNVEAFIERMSPSKRGTWFSRQRSHLGTLLGFAWWDVQINRR